RAPELAVRDAERELSQVRKLPRRLFDPSADEWVGLVEPGDADHEFGRLDLPGLKTRDERLHHPDTSGDVPRHRPGMVQARGQREATVDRHEPEGWLEADDAAAGGGNPDRAGGGGTEGRVG